MDVVSPEATLHRVDINARPRTSELTPKATHENALSLVPVGLVEARLRLVHPARYKQSAPAASVSGCSEPCCSLSGLLLGESRYSPPQFS